MKRKKLQVTILKEEIGYSAHVKAGKIFIATEGGTWTMLIENLIEATQLAFDCSSELFTKEDFVFRYDLASFFDFYKVLNAKALSERIGMNQSLMAQYIQGIKKPSIRQVQRILEGIQQVGKELAEVQFLT